jgi:uncharacterized protein YkwD
LRKLVVAILAVPVIVALYAQTGLRRSIPLRMVLTIGVGALIGLASLSALGAESTAARPVSTIAPIAESAFSSALHTKHGLHDPVDVTFSRPMDPASVVAALQVDPFVGIELAWNEGGTELSIAPAQAWAPDTYYTISVGESARDASGDALASPIRAAFLTRPATSAQIGATKSIRGRLAISSGLRISFDHPVALDAVRDALRTTPAIDGTFSTQATPGADTSLARAVTGTSFVFTPAGSLPAGITVRASLADGLVDTDGSSVVATAVFTAQTSSAPEVVRFRPRGGSSDVTRGASLSVRFSEAMNAATTQAAFSVTVNGRPLTGGRTRWAEGRTVLVLDPDHNLPYGAKVRLAVGPGAQASSGSPIATSAAATFSVEAKPKPKRAAPRAVSTHRTTSTRIARPTTGGWSGVEVYYLRLMNCTRTGGWVTSSGSCSSPGGRNVAPLRLDSGISSRVSRPYAKYLATHNQCSHFIGGTPGDRLRRAGYTSYRWAENIGCRSGNPYSAVLGSHLFFQSEKPYGGGHYVNLMNSMYDRVGIGVWVYAGRVRLVVDFYHP